MLYFPNPTSDPSMYFSYVPISIHRLTNSAENPKRSTSKDYDNPILTV